MATFRPPVDLLVTWADRNTTGIFAALKPFPRGRNVFKLVDGSFTENQPMNPDLIDKIYHGGHLHTVSGQEQADLVAAGYGEFIEE